MKKCQAFSIIEQLLVVAAVAILCCLSVPKLFFLQEYALHHDIDKLFMVCSYVRQRAISTHRQHDIIFNQTNGSYSYTGMHNKNYTVYLSSGVGFGFLKGVWGPPASPKKAINSFTTFRGKGNGSTLSFFHNGSATAGTVYFVDSRDKLMGALTCGLSQVSYVRKYRYSNGKWIALQ